MKKKFDTEIINFNAIKKEWRQRTKGRIKRKTITTKFNEITQNFEILVFTNYRNKK